MHKINILELADVQHIVEDVQHLKASLCDKNILIYTNEDYTALAFYKRINTFLLEAHVESTEECRGYKLKQFLISSGKEAVSTDDRITSVINFVDKNNKRLLLFSATFANRVGSVGKKTMFVTEKERYI
jgi:hypothetical protein